MKALQVNSDILPNRVLLSNFRSKITEFVALLAFTSIFGCSAYPVSSSAFPFLSPPPQSIAKTKPLSDELGLIRIYSTWMYLYLYIPTYRQKRVDATGDLALEAYLFSHIFQRISRCGGGICIIGRYKTAANSAYLSSYTPRGALSVHSEADAAARDTFADAYLYRSRARDGCNSAIRITHK